MQGDTIYKQFLIPLLQQLDTYKVNMEASEAQYERSMKEMSQKIKETEAASMENGRKRQRGNSLFTLQVALSCCCTLHKKNWMMICLFLLTGLSIMALFLAAFCAYSRDANDG